MCGERVRDTQKKYIIFLKSINNIPIYAYIDTIRDGDIDRQAGRGCSWNFS